MNRNQLGIAVNVALTLLWGYIALKMIFTDYTPSRAFVFWMVVMLALDALVSIASYRLKYWQEQKALAEKEAMEWVTDPSATRSWFCNTDPNLPLKTHEPVKS